ncbi:MAG: ABC transporter ATP-binding protein [Planctomycetota bacterium]|jgi:ABC-2 type transport system ATP-binding protein
MSLVEIRNLSRSFGKIHAVRDVSFAFDGGEIFGFIGPNGAGKSTTMRILASLDLPSSGDCLIDGMSTADEADRVRAMIGYMPDAYGSYPRMTVWEYLDFFARAHRVPVERRDARVAEVMAFCQLEGLRDKLITTLSKGMKQRLCLGRCIIHDPRILILDEPSAGLDPRARIEFRDLLRILAEQGKAILISSHILTELEDLCHGVAIIEQGRLVATGSVAAIKDQARSARPTTSDDSQDQTPAHVLDIRLANDHERIDAICAEQPGLDQVRIEGRQITAHTRLDAAGQAALLKRLIDSGLSVNHFACREDRLEDLFMNLTEGKVQ